MGLTSINTSQFLHIVSRSGFPSPEPNVFLTDSTLSTVPVLGCLTTNVFRRSVPHLEFAESAKVSLTARLSLDSACLAASVCLARTYRCTGLQNNVLLHTKRSFTLRVCIQSYDVSHSLSDVLTRDFGTRESFSACWVISLVVSYCIHSEVRAVFAGRRTVLVHGLGGWWKGRWWWNNWNRVKGWRAWSCLNATP